MHFVVFIVILASLRLTAASVYKLADSADQWRINEVVIKDKMMITDTKLSSPRDIRPAKRQQ